VKFIGNFLSRGLILGSLLALACSTSAFSAAITIAGTGDSQHLLRLLAQSYHQKHPGQQILIPNSVGSGGGIKLLLAGRTELARVARPLKPKEHAEGLQYHNFAYSPVVFVANLPNNCLDNITTTEYLDILGSKITNWKQLGNCADNKIYVANREEGDSSKLVLEKQISELKNISNPAGRTIYSTPETYETLNRYPYSFGYLPKSQIHKDNLTMLKFNGIAASTENIQQGRYPLVVPLGIVWNGEPTGLTKNFIDFLFSSEARKIIEQAGAVPAKPE